MAKAKAKVEGLAFEPQPKPQVQTEPETEVKPLYFDHSGWCEELGKSYHQGHYWPKDLAEYLALEKFSSPAPR